MLCETFMSRWRARALELFPDMRSEIHSSESVGRFWIELTARFKDQYRSETGDEPKEPPTVIRNTCLYAVWCERSESPDTREAAGIEFYEYLPSFALQCPRPSYQRLIRDLVANLGIEEVEKMGVSLEPAESRRFLADARQANEDRRRRSRKR